MKIFNVFTIQEELSMRAMELKKMMVLDNNGAEIGKLSDLGIDYDEFKIRNILVSAGGFFSKKYFYVDVGDLDGIDTCVHVKRSEEGIDQVDLKNVTYERYFFRDFQNLYSASADAILIGPVKDLCINLDDNLTFKPVLDAMRLCGRYRKNDCFIIDLDDIDAITEFIALNLTKDEIKQRIKDYDVKEC